jgi:rod shape-determining protein MreC
VPGLSGTRRHRRRDLALAISVLLFALFLLFGPSAWSRPIRQGLRATALKPFIAVRGWIASRQADREDLREVRAERDSLAAVATAQAVLAEENARLRGLLALRERVGARFIATQLLRLGTGAADGTFLIDAGADDGVVVGSPVFTVGGLVGVVREVSARSAQAVDWTHPEFRVSGMTANGQVYGVLEARRGTYREEDLLLMTGAPFHSDVRPGSRIVTSGRGEVFPRGIPIGEVLAIESADTGWRKSYIVRPYVRPESAAQVLVGLKDAGTEDLSTAWEIQPRPPATKPDSLVPSATPPAAPSRTP